MTCNNGEIGGWTITESDIRNGVTRLSDEGLETN
nr:MAG TPA: hypothetical protein [Caudoviricetes sp.]